MASVNMQGFKPVKFSFGQIHFSGGFVGKPIPVNSRTVSDESGHSNMTFVKMACSETWLLLATTGHKRHNAGSFGRTSLLEDLRDKVQKYCDGEVSSSSAVPVAIEEYDPMMEVEQDREDSELSPCKIKSQGYKRMRYYKNSARQSVATIDMPARCPEEDPDCTEVRQIKLHVVDRKTIWLHMDDVEWAVRYLYVQNLLKGVPLVPEDSAGPESSAVAERGDPIRDGGAR